MREIALHLLDIAENSVAAQARSVIISVCEDLRAGRLVASVADDGKGMDAELVARIADPFVTSRTTRKVGLGIPLLKAAAEACEGGLTIASEPGKGTLLTVEFRHDHIDRMPLGDLASTLLNLVVAYPTIDWQMQYEVILPLPQGQAEFCFDNREIKAILGDVSLTEPDILAFLRRYIEEGVSEIQIIAEAQQSGQFYAPSSGG